MKQQSTFSAIMKDFPLDFAFFKSGEELRIFKGLQSFGKPQSPLTVHWPEFYHLAFQFLNFAEVEIHQWEAAPSPLLPLTWQSDWKAPSKEFYRMQFDHIIQLLRSGDLQKAVPVVFETAPDTPPRESILIMIDHLLQQPNSYAYGVVLGDRGVLGATPEMLFSTSKNQLKSMAIAGTKWSGSDQSPEEELKLQHEHQLVIQDIQKKLEKISNVKVGESYLLKLPNLTHLKTDIQAELWEAPSGPKDIYFLTKRLHPTSALGMFSDRLMWKEMEIWPGQEHPRRSFGAPLTFQWSIDEALSLVGIRQIAWDFTGSRIGSGGGLVDRSDFENEWQELNQKRQAVKKMLGLAGWA